MRKPIVAGNWKMHKTAAEAVDLAQAIAPLVAPSLNNCDVVLCPTYTSLGAVHGVIGGSGIGLGAQNMHWEGEGAYTGDISPAMILTSGCTYVILGHSERRQYAFESDEMVNRKTLAALAAGLIPIVCIGEQLEQREAGRVEEEMPRPSALEFWLLKLIVGTSEESLLEWLFQHLDMNWVRHPYVKQALIFRLDRLVEHQAFDVPELLASFSNGEATSLVTEAAAEQRAIPNPQEQLSDIVLRLRNLHIDEELRRLAQAPREAAEDELVQAAQMLELQRLKRQPLEMLADA